MGTDLIFVVSLRRTRSITSARVPIFTETLSSAGNSHTVQMLSDKALNTGRLLGRRRSHDRSPRQCLTPTAATPKRSPPETMRLMSKLTTFYRKLSLCCFGVVQFTQ